MDYQDHSTIALLNEDLFGEHDAILYYLTHAWTVARQYGHQILEIANDEMRHFKWLGHTITQLGGTPDLSTPKINPTLDIQAALKKDVAAEIHAIDQYQTHIEMISKDSVKALLQRIVVDERDHLRQFQELLDQTHGEPEPNTHDDKEITEIAQRLQTTVHLEYQQMMAYLLQSFMKDHHPPLGMDMEERSVDEMHHMGWLAKRMGSLGITPTFPKYQQETIQHGEDQETLVYQDMRNWAVHTMPSLVPVIDRIIAQEDYHAHS